MNTTYILLVGFLLGVLATAAIYETVIHHEITTNRILTGPPVKRPNPDKPVTPGISDEYIRPLVGQGLMKARSHDHVEWTPEQGDQA